MKRMLMVASVASTIGQFNMENIKVLQSMGYAVDVACNLEDRSIWGNDKLNGFKKQMESCGVKCHQIDFSRKMFDVMRHVRAYRQLLKILGEKQYEFIHCHTPIAGALARLAAHKRKVKVVYTAHGFHFFEGAPLKNWLFFYPIERFLSKITDVLITITKDDYILACRKFKMKECRYVPGVGLDIQKVKNAERSVSEIRQGLGIPSEAVVMISVGELNKNKNHEMVLRSLGRIGDPRIYYMICGIGKCEDELKRLIEELNLDDRVKLLGYRKDVYALLYGADIYIHPSYREGLSVAIMEAMAVGLPVICSDIRGNCDLIDNNGGILIVPSDERSITDAVVCLAEDEGKRKFLGDYNQRKIKQFAVDGVREQMTQIYQMFK